MVTDLYLLRHQKVLGAPALYGHTDIAVDDDLQRELASTVAAQIHSQTLNVSQLISSPLIRCHRLSQLVQQRTELPLSVDSSFQEMSFGEYDGVTFDSMSQQRWQQLEPFWSAPAKCQLPQAESLESFHARVQQALMELVSQKKNSLLITHGGVIRAILAYVLDLDWRNPKLYSTLAIGNATVTHIQIHHYQDITWQVKSIGAAL
jgi:alpha-ribazole phosphatase